jgi:hypothetical protein
VDGDGTARDERTMVLPRAGDAAGRVEGVAGDAIEALTERVRPGHQCTSRKPHQNRWESPRPVAQQWIVAEGREREREPQYRSFAWWSRRSWRDPGARRWQGAGLQQDLQRLRRSRYSARRYSVSVDEKRLQHRSSVTETDGGPGVDSDTVWPM